jgi:hypothetical protein
MKRTALTLALPFLVLLARLPAQEPFSLSGSSNTTRVTAGGSSFPDLFESGLRAEGRFRVLDGQSALYTLRYADVENAMNFSINGAGTEAEFVIPITGFSRTFTGTDREDLEDQLVDFLKSDGAGIYQDFMEAINRLSAVAVTDGNPSAATATIATSVFMDNAFDAGSDEWSTENAGGEDGKARVIGGYPEFSVISAAGFDGSSWGYEVPLPRGRFGDSRVGYKFSMPLRYRDIEGAQSGSAGLTMAFPVQIKKPQFEAGEPTVEDGEGDRVLYRPRKNGLVWRITPSASGIGAGSADFAAGSLLYAGALSNSAEYKFNDKFRATFGNQFTLIEGVSDISIQGYDVGTEISQQMTKTGLHLAWTPRASHTLAAYTIFSAFLQDAAVPEFWTWGFEYSYLPSVIKEEGLNPIFTLRGYADLADENYEAYGVRVGAGFVF